MFELLKRYTWLGIVKRVRNLITKLDHFLIGSCNNEYQDPEYDRALHRYFWTYHNLVDLMVRVAVNEVEDLFTLSPLLLPVVKTFKSASIALRSNLLR